MKPLRKFAKTSPFEQNLPLDKNPTITRRQGQQMFIRSAVYICLLALVLILTFFCC